MSNLLDLTSFFQIRGVLTVSTADLPDSVLADYGLEDDLLIDITDWLPEWETVRDAGDRSSTLLKLYAKYRCAALVAASGQNFTLVQFTDGANAGQRSDTEGFQKLRESMESRAWYYRKQLIEELSVEQVGTALSVMGAATPSRDPVTQGRT